MLEDRLLIWKYNRGNRRALEPIYQKYKDDLTTLAAALLFNKDAGEDVVHDVFVSFIASCGRFKLTGSLKSYLTTCVVNNVRNRNKAVANRRCVELNDAAPLAAVTDRPDASLIFGENSARLAHALEQLPYEQREALLLHLYSEMKFKTIAQSQDESINTIQGRYRYALEKLRSLLNGEVQK